MSLGGALVIIIIVKLENGLIVFFFQITQLCFVLDAILPLVSSDAADSFKTIGRKRTRESGGGNDMAVPLNSMITFVAGMGVLEAVFIQASYLSLGALLTNSTTRHAFDETVKRLSGFVAGKNAGTVPSQKQHLKYVPCDDEPTWYDYYLDFNKLEWVPWRNAVPEYVHDDTVEFNDILVPTVESTRLMWILKLINEVRMRN